MSLKPVDEDLHRSALYTEALLFRVKPDPCCSCLTLLDTDLGEDPCLGVGGSTCAEVDITGGGTDTDTGKAWYGTAHHPYFLAFLLLYSSWQSP